MNAFRLAAALALSALLTAPHAAAQADLALVLAVDVSGSVDDGRFKLQREAIAEALDSDEFAALAGAGRHGAIEIAVLEWAEEQQVILPWTVVRRHQDLSELAQLLRTAPRSWLHPKTDPAAAIAAGDRLLSSAPLAPERRVIDVSGDGRQNEGERPTEAARDAAVARDITVNGLPILSPADPTVDAWYRDNVMGGAGAFVTVADGFEAFADAFRRKLMREVAGAPAATDVADAATPYDTEHLDRYTAEVTWRFVWNEDNRTMVCRGQGSAIFLGGSRFLTAAHVVDQNPVTDECAEHGLADPVVSFGSADLHGRIAKAAPWDDADGLAYPGGMDLALVEVDARMIPVELRSAAPLALCDGEAPVGAEVRIATEFGVDQARTRAPASRDFTRIDFAARRGDSGGGVFDQTHRCLLGIISNGGAAGTNYVPSAAIRRFLGESDSELAESDGAPFTSGPSCGRRAATTCEKDWTTTRRHHAAH